MKKKKWAYISLEVVFLLTIVVISGMYGTIKLFKHGQEAADQQNTAFEKVRSTLATGEGGLGGGGIPVLPDEPSDTIYWCLSEGTLKISSNENCEGRSRAVWVGPEDKGDFGIDSIFDPDSAPWYTYHNDIERIVVVDRVSPTSLDNWFVDLQNVSYADVSLLDTSRVESMYFVFGYLGANLYNPVEIIGLNNWDTSNVIDMSAAFFNANISSLDLSAWDASSTEYMTCMFFGMGDISGNIRMIKTPKNIRNDTDLNYGSQTIIGKTMYDANTGTEYPTGTFPVSNGSNSITLTDTRPAVASTFTIDGTTYQFEEGMTWEDWVDSSYNTLGLYYSILPGYVYDVNYDDNDLIVTYNNGGKKIVLQMSKL